MGSQQRATGVHCTCGVGVVYAAARQTLPYPSSLCDARHCNLSLQGGSLSTVRDTAHRPCRDAAATVTLELAAALDLAHEARWRLGPPTASDMVPPEDTDTAGGWGARGGRRAVNPLLRRSAPWEPMHRNDRRETQARVRTPSLGLHTAAIRLRCAVRRHVSAV